MGCFGAFFFSFSPLFLHNLEFPCSTRALREAEKEGYIRWLSVVVVSLQRWPPSTLSHQRACGSTLREVLSVSLLLNPGRPNTCLDPENAAEVTLCQPGANVRGLPTSAFPTGS